MSIPIFKNTEHAEQYGKSIENDFKAIQSMKEFRAMNLHIAKKMSKAGHDEQAFFLISGQSQLCRECIESATHTGGFKKNILKR